MKKIIFTVLILCAITAYGQKPQWQWARVGGNGSNYGRAVDVATDKGGNAMVVGSFYGGAIALGNFTLTPVGSTDVFIAKYDNTGNVLWATSLGGNDVDEPYSVAVDDSGNTYVAGAFSSLAISVGNITITNSGFDDIFIAKYNAAGALVYLNKIGGTDRDFWPMIACDNNGNTYIGGQFQSAAINIANTTLINNGSADVFIAKYNNMGTGMWAMSAGSFDWDEVKGIKVSNDGYLYATGAFNFSNSWGPFNINSSGGYDMFVTKISDNGTVIWAKNFGNFDNENPEALALSDDAIYVCGSFSSSSFSFGNATLTNTGGADWLLCKLDTAGNPLWALSGDSPEYESLYSLALSSDGHLYAGGYFWSALLTWGNDTATSPTAFNAQYALAQADTAGNFGWVKAAQGNWEERCTGIAINQYNDIYSVGHTTSDQLSFDTISNIVPFTNFNPMPIVSMIKGNSGVSIPNVANTFANKLFPNPASHYIYMYNTGSKVSVHDAMGRFVHVNVVTLNGRYMQLDIQNLPSGIYYVASDDTKRREKFVKVE